MRRSSTKELVECIPTRSPSPRIRDSGVTFRPFLNTSSVTVRDLSGLIERPAIVRFSGRVTDDQIKADDRLRELVTRNVVRRLREQLGVSHVGPVAQLDERDDLASPFIAR